MTGVPDEARDDAVSRPVRRIVRFAPNQVYQTYEWNGATWSGTNFIVMPGDGYAVEVETISDWVPEIRE